MSEWKATYGGGDQSPVPNPAFVSSSNRVPVGPEHADAVAAAAGSDVVDTLLPRDRLVGFRGLLMVSIGETRVERNGLVTVLVNGCRWKMRMEACPHCEFSLTKPCNLCGGDGVVFVRDGDVQSRL